MKQKIGIQRACFAVLVLVVTLTGCGASSDSTSSTETSLAEMPLCAALESNLERILLRYTDLAVEVANFRTGALLPSGPEKQIADWYCEMSERFPGQMSFVGDENEYLKRPTEFLWGLNFLTSQFGLDFYSWWMEKLKNLGEIQILMLMTFSLVANLA